MTSVSPLTSSLSESTKRRLDGFHLVYRLGEAISTLGEILGGHQSSALSPRLARGEVTSDQRQVL